MQLLKAKPVQETFFAEMRKTVSTFQKQYTRTPKLVVILVGDDPASQVYTSKKSSAAQSVGIEPITIKFNDSVSPDEVLNTVNQLNNDPSVDGILIQRPLPKSFNEESVAYWVDPKKDVDAFHPTNVGRLHLGLNCLKPCTPLGVIQLLNYYKLSIEGKNACIIGRSSIVGKPMAALLLQNNATVIHCHSKTKNLTDLTKASDILVVAAGKPHLINESHIKKDAIVIDVGIHRTSSGKLTGDVDFDSTSKLASAITPVPGGVGPMTITMLLHNTIDAAQNRVKT